MVTEKMFAAVWSTSPLHDFSNYLPFVLSFPTVWLWSR